MSAESDDDRRDAFRIDSNAMLEFRVVTEEDLPEILDKLNDRRPDRFAMASGFVTTSMQMNRILRTVRGDHPELARYLQMLDHKLNYLATIFMAEDLGPDQHSTMAVNLSTHGMAFDSQIGRAHV